MTVYLSITSIIYGGIYLYIIIWLIVTISKDMLIIHKTALLEWGLMND